MAKKYDAIVIGAGLGGLSGATMLARNGKSVLLLEKHNVPGGYSTSFVRGKYEFEIALHELSGVGRDKNGDIYRYLDYLGVADKVEFIHVENLYRSVFPELDVTLPAGWEPYEAKLCELFPHEAQGIRRFLRRVRDFAHEFGQMARSEKRPHPLAMPFKFPNAFRYLPVTWGHVLYRDVKDPYARAVISQYWGYFGMAPSVLTFVYYALGLASYLKYGPTFIKGRSQTLGNAFFTRFRELGGEARMNCEVEKITTQNGRVTGVVTRGGEEYTADWILSNADPVATCSRMIGTDKVPASFFQKLQSSNVAASTVNVYLGVNKSVQELGLVEHENFVNPHPDFDALYDSGKALQSPTSMLITPYNVVYPEISPPGTSIVVLTALAYGEPWVGIEPQKYVATKNDIADDMIELAEKHAPGLREAAEVVEVATPITNMRYTGALGGSIYGFDQPPRDNVAWRMGHRGPLEGLYFVGAWTQPGGGFGPTMISGQMAGAQVLRQAKKS